jgi:hypothetical protein
LRTGAPGKTSTERMAEKGDLFIWTGLLTVAWILTILEMRVEKEN